MIEPTQQQGPQEHTHNIELLKEVLSTNHFEEVQDFLAIYNDGKKKSEQEMLKPRKDIDAFRLQVAHWTAQIQEEIPRLLFLLTQNRYLISCAGNNILLERPLSEGQEVIMNEHGVVCDKDTQQPLDQGRVLVLPADLDQLDKQEIKALRMFYQTVITKKQLSNKMQAAKALVNSLSLEREKEWHKQSGILEKSWEEKEKQLRTHPAITTVLPALIESGLLRFVTVYREDAVDTPHRYYYGPFDSIGDSVEAYVLLSPELSQAEDIKVLADWEDFLSGMSLDGVSHTLTSEDRRFDHAYVDAHQNGKEVSFVVDLMPFTHDEKLETAYEILSNAIQLGLWKNQELHSVVEEIGTSITQQTLPSQ